MLALNYETGIDFIPNEAKKREYIEKGVELDADWALRELASILIDNEEDVERGFDYLVKAAEKGDSIAFNELGYYYWEGKSVEKDIDKSIEYWSKAGELGYAQAYANLAFLYENGDGVEENIDKAIEYYQKAADLGVGSSYGHIAILYQQGKGVDEDIEKAMEYAKKGTDLGSGFAAYGVAYFYENYLEDEEEAYRWYEKAAELGFEESILFVASNYLAEQTDESFKKAIDLYKIGMRNGSAECFCNLGAMYNMGHGVEIDNAMAAKLLLTAEKLGSENATQLMQVPEIKEEVEKISDNK